jgi:hypothetical protein
VKNLSQQSPSVSEFFLGTKVDEDDSGLSSHCVLGCHAIDISCINHFFMISVANNHSTGQQVSSVRALTPVIRETFEQLGIIEIGQI